MLSQEAGLFLLLSAGQNMFQGGAGLLLSGPPVRNASLCDLLCPTYKIFPNQPLSAPLNCHGGKRMVVGAVNGLRAVVAPSAGAPAGISFSYNLTFPSLPCIEMGCHCHCHTRLPRSHGMGWVVPATLPHVGLWQKSVSCQKHIKPAPPPVRCRAARLTCTSRRPPVGTRGGGHCTHARGRLSDPRTPFYRAGPLSSPGAPFSFSFCSGSL